LDLKQEILTHALDIPITSEEEWCLGVHYSVIESIKANADDELTYRFIQYIEDYDYSLNAEHCKEYLEIMREKFTHARNDAKFRSIFLRELRSLT
jgi:hypothetical protein